MTDKTADNKDSRANAGFSAAADAGATPEAAKELFEALGYPISPGTLVQAFTHKSFSHENPAAVSYERLEFLGDAVLELVVTETLFAHEKNFSEGQMAKIRAATVCEPVLASVARRMNLSRFILLGNGEIRSNGADKSSILCDVVESLIGAVFIEHGIEAARDTVHRLIDSTLEITQNEGPALDWKTSLAQLVHKNKMGEITYRMEVSGPEYAPVFTARVFIGNDSTDNTENSISNERGKENADKENADKKFVIKEFAQASASSKKKAQLAAAEKAWRIIQNDDSTDSVAAPNGANSPSASGEANADHAA